MLSRAASARQTLLIDADDTLWENNIYFEQAFDEFVRFLNHPHLTAEQVRAALDEIEKVNNKLYGYGSENFARNLCQCFERLAAREIRPEDLEWVRNLGEKLKNHPMEIIEGVPETLGCLSRRHDLILFTKGQPEEQRLKIERSGLGGYFRHTAIVKEKDAAAYRRLASELGITPQETWMVGNSPKSDINPALEVGMNAVFIPHDHTWTLEREPLASGPGRLLTLERFSELKQWF